MQIPFLGVKTSASKLIAKLQEEFQNDALKIQIIQKISTSQSIKILAAAFTMTLVKYKLLPYSISFPWSRG